MALEQNEPVFTNFNDEIKYRRLTTNLQEASYRIHELSEFVLKLKTAQFECAPKLEIYGASVPDFIEIRQITKTDWELLNQWKNLINGFDL